MSPHVLHGLNGFDEIELSAQSDDSSRPDADCKYKATALVYDVRVQLPTTRAKSDAIAVALDHRDNYSVVVFFPYRRDGSKLVMGELFAQKGSADIFSAH